MYIIVDHRTGNVGRLPEGSIPTETDKAIAKDGDTLIASVWGHKLTTSSKFYIPDHPQADPDGFVLVGYIQEMVLVQDEHIFSSEPGLTESEAKGLSDKREYSE